MLVLGAQLTTPPGSLPELMQEYNQIGDPTFFMPAFLWLFFVISIGWGLVRRDQRVGIIGVWCVLAFLSANPSWLHLPGEGAINNFAILIAAYIPISILVGSALGWLVNARSIIRRQAEMAGLGVVLIGLTIWGTSQRLGDLHIVQSELVTRADLRAIEWIRQNTPQDARFLVNSFFAYANTVIVGSDGGWWLPLLALRQTSLPPITYGMETGSRPDFREWVNALPAEIQKKSIGHSDIIALLKERRITHIYIGQRQGRVNYEGTLTLQPAQLLNSASFRLLYRQDRVWVYEIE